MVDRIEHAPRAYLLSQEPPDIARQAAFVEPVPARGDASVSVLPLEPGRWRIEVAARDRPGLLATISGRPGRLRAGHRRRHRRDVGGRRRARVVPRRERYASRARPRRTRSRLEARIVAAFSEPLESFPNPDADLRFDDHASPWYTICEVRSPDRRGLLRSLTAAMAASAANVHSARLVTIDNAAVDRFELTDRNGRKLDDTAKAALLDAVRAGVTRKRKRFSRRG